MRSICIDKTSYLGYDVYKVAHPDPSPFGAKRASFLCISQSFSGVHQGQLGKT